jgi:hypothetical protein
MERIIWKDEETETSKTTACNWSSSIPARTSIRIRIRNNSTDRLRSHPP